MGSIAFGITIDVPPVSILYVPSGLAPADAYHVRRSSMTYCAKLMSEATGFASLLPGFLTRFVTAYNLQRTNPCPGLNFRELMYGRIKLMTALCPAWAHTCHTMLLGVLATDGGFKRNIDGTEEAGWAAADADADADDDHDADDDDADALFFLTLRRWKMSHI